MKTIIPDYMDSWYPPIFIAKGLVNFFKKDCLDIKIALFIHSIFLGAPVGYLMAIAKPLIFPSIMLNVAGVATITFLAHAVLFGH